MGGNRGQGTATVVFTDLVGSTDLLARLGEAAFDELRRAHFASLRVAIDRTHGRQIKTLGDGVLAVFGSAAQAVACSVGMQQAVERQARHAQSPLALKVGIALGDVSFEEDDVFGTPVVEAARLVASAGPGQILVTNVVRRVAGGRCPASFTDPAPLELKGLPNPVQVCRVEWELGLPEYPEAPAPTDPATAFRTRPPATSPGGLFVGREWELAQLASALDQAAAGRGQLLVISGEAGIGKSRLLSEVADRAAAQRMHVLWGRCWEGEEAPTLWPWVQIFRPLLAVMDPAAPTNVGRQVPADLARLIPELHQLLEPDVEARPQPPSDQARFRLFDAATMLIRTAAGSQPLLLILEDLHEADRTSLLLLEFVARQLRDVPLLAVATYREPEADLSPQLMETLGKVIRSGHRFHLTGLRSHEIGEFLRRGFEIVLSETALTEIEEGTSGNPFFLDELARRFVAEHQLRSIPGGGFEVPEGLKGPIRSHLAALAPAGRGLLELASVIGREFSLELLVEASTMPKDAVLGAMGSLASLRLVDQAGLGLGRYRFAHALVRETIYQDLPTATRWELHRRIGRSIEAIYASALDEHLDQLAHHFSRAAALGEVERAIDYAQKAGQRATRRFGYDEAIDHFRRALELTQSPYGPASRRFDLTLALGDAQWWGGHVGEASETFRAAAFLAREMGNPSCLAESALRVGEVGYGGPYMQAWSFDALRVELLEEALGALGEEESPLKVRVLGRLSTALYFSPFDSTARRESLSQASVDLARRLGDGPALGYALNARHLAVWGPDNLEERLALGGEVVELAHECRDVSLELRGRVWRLADLLESGDVVGADREIDAFEELAERVGYPHFLAYAFMFRALQAILRGDFAAAERLSMRSRQLGDQIGDVNIQLSHRIQIAFLRGLQGRVDDVVAQLEIILREHPPVLRTWVRRGFLFLAGDRTGIAEDFPAMWHSRHHAPPAFWLVNQSGTALFAASISAERETAALYDVLVPYERRWVLAGRDAVICLWPVAYPLGVLAASLSRFDVAAGHFEMALEAAERAGARPHLAMAQAAFGAMLLRRGSTLDRRRGAELLSAALRTAEELGMSALYDEVTAARAGLDAEPAVEPAALGESPESGVFQREGEFWAVDFQGTVIRLKDSKGLGYLQRLLASPGSELHVLDLAAGGSPAPRRGAGEHLEGFSPSGTSADRLLDPAAKAAYRARIEELRDAVEEAEENNDPERAARARDELDFIVAELAQALGLGGRDREATSAGERARSAVTKALHASLRRIEHAHPALGAHLATTIRTGYFCSYKPDPRVPVQWRT